MRLTTHAQERWKQRCDHLCLSVEIGSSKPAGKTLLNRLRRSWERSQGVGTWPAHHAYMVSTGGALFIVCDGTIITVLLVKDIKRWSNRTERDDRSRRRGSL